ACGASSRSTKRAIDSRSWSCSSVKMKCFLRLAKSGFRTFAAVAMAPPIGGGARLTEAWDKVNSGTSYFSLPRAQGSWIDPDIRGQVRTVPLAACEVPDPEGDPLPVKSPLHEPEAAVHVRAIQQDGVVLRRVLPRMQHQPNARELAGV